MPVQRSANPWTAPDFDQHLVSPEVRNAPSRFIRRQSRHSGPGRRRGAAGTACRSPHRPASRGVKGGIGVGVAELRLDDRDTYVRIFTHRLLTRYLGIDRLDRRQAEESFVQALVQRGAESRSRQTLAVCPPSPGSDSMIGTIGLSHEGYGSNAMITGLAVLPGSSVSGHTHEAGRLLPAYAFGHLGPHRVWAGHRSDHTRMRPVMRAAAFTQEATLGQLFRTSGIWHDVTTYTALAPEWKCQATQAETAVLEGGWPTRLDRTSD